MGTAGLRFFREQVERATRPGGGTAKGRNARRKNKGQASAPGRERVLFVCPGGFGAGRAGGAQRGRAAAPQGRRSRRRAERRRSRGRQRWGQEQKSPPAAGGRRRVKTGSCGGFGRGGGRSGLGGDIEIRPAGVDGAQQQRGGDGGCQDQQDDRGKVRRGQKSG